MKKRNNKTIVLIVIGIFFVVLFGIFILNYSKDDASFSILEKKWISDNTSNIIDVSVYNDVPVYGNKGKGVIFDLLNDFTDKYKINFNKVSYLSSSSSNLKTTAFRILNSNTELTDNDILPPVSFAKSLVDKPPQVVSPLKVAVNFKPSYLRFDALPTNDAKVAVPVVVSISTNL